METMNGNSNGKPSSRESGEYFELLKFKSVGADPNRLRDCVQCAMWLKGWLEKTGAEAKLLLPEGGGLSATPPVVFAERAGDPGAPCILVYGHYDVQPPDPEEEWLTPPFEPVERDGRVYCRGAQDDKGQMFAFLCGVRDYLESNPSVVPAIKFIFEGQEESGSGALGKIAEELGDQLRAGVLLVSDTGAAADLRPAIVAGLRGVSHLTVRLSSANADLHSGHYGGIAPNAAQGMAELVASLHNPDGSIAVRGFCDRVVEPTAEELELAKAAAMTDEEYVRETGVAPCGGEKGLSAIERGSFRPTIEVNGIHSGYGGPGSKTVIPCSAVAKLSMRLVAGQNPAECMDLLVKHLKAHVPEGMKLSVEDVTGEAFAMKLPVKSPVFRLAADVLGEMDPRGAVFQWEGASIPIVSTLARISGAAPLLVGFGQGEDRIHSPNESFSWRQFALCRRWAQDILRALCE